MTFKCLAINGTSIFLPPHLGEHHERKEETIIRPGRRGHMWNTELHTWHGCFILELTAGVIVYTTLGQSTPIMKGRCACGPHPSLRNNILRTYLLSIDVIPYKGKPNCLVTSKIMSDFKSSGNDKFITLSGRDSQWTCICQPRQLAFMGILGSLVISLTFSL